MYACIALCICTHSIEYTYGETTLYIISSGTPNMLSVVEEGVSVIFKGRTEIHRLLATV